MHIHYTTRFMYEVDEQADYQAQHSPARASLFVDNIFRQIYFLKRNPHMGRKVPEIGNEAVRELLLRQFRLVYQLVSAERIDVLTLQTGLRPLRLSL